jgi:alkaline phosphatase
MNTAISRFHVTLAAGLIVLMALAAAGPVRAAGHGPAADSGATVDQQTAPAKNVIVMIPDGCSTSIQTLARWLQGRDLALDGMLTGAVRTHAANSVITGSAAAASALACGHKTTVGFLGIGPRTRDLLSAMEPPGEDLVQRPLASVLEAARLAGKSTGLVATCHITHATPAGFAAHVPNRGMFNDIMEQLVFGGIDVVLAGGRRYLLPTSQGGARTDGQDLLAVLHERGVQVVGTVEEMAAVSSGKLWGLFGGEHLHPDIDRAELAPHEPSLAEMTAKAIELLAQNGDGFLLVVEGSQVDWAGHTNDPIHMVTDFVAFDRAVGAAVAFAARDGQTLILAFPDHDCGGLSIGSEHAGVSYSSTTVEDLVDPLRDMIITSAGLARKIGGDRSPQRIRQMLAEWWSWQPDEAVIAEIIAAAGSGTSLHQALSDAVSRHHTVLGWTTHGHTGGDVPLWAYGPGRPAGLVDNTELARTAAGALGLDLEETTGRLFVEAGSAFGDDAVTIDRSDRHNPIVVIGPARLPANQNLLLMDGREHRLEGVVVYIPATDRAYLPRQAVDLIRERL